MTGASSNGQRHDSTKALRRWRDRDAIQNGAGRKHVLWCKCLRLGQGLRQLEVPFTGVLMV